MTSGGKVSLLYWRRLRARILTIPLFIWVDSARVYLFLGFFSQAFYREFFNTAFSKQIKLTLKVY